MNEYNDPQFERIKAVFNTQEIPCVTGETLHRYFEYLKENLTCPCMLTGIESIGYFSWEERFSFGHGSKEAAILNLTNLVLWRHGQLEPVNHKINQMLPTLEQDVAHQSSNVVEKRFPGRECLAEEEIFFIH